MSCSLFVHNVQGITQMEVSGTSCSGTLVNYLLSYGQSVCMRDDLPIINLQGLQISGSCLSVTPTPSVTPPVNCYSSGLTYYTATYQCPNDGLDYLDQYGVIKVEIYDNFANLNPNHPEYNFLVTNGTDTEVLKIENGQSFNEFIFPKVDFTYGTTACTQTILPNWYISNTAGLSQCVFITPTPTPTITNTQTYTPTITPTPSTTPCVCWTGMTYSYTGTVTGERIIDIVFCDGTTSFRNANGTSGTGAITNPGCSRGGISSIGTIISPKVYQNQFIGCCGPDITNVPTPTLTSTPTQTPTLTNTKTPTPTLTNTNTPTMTPSPTANPLCPEQLSVAQGNFPDIYYQGVYNRVHSYTGGTLVGGYFQTTTSINSGYFVPDINFPQNNILYAVFSKYEVVNNRYYTLLIRTSGASWNQSFGIIRSSGDFIYNGGTRDSSAAVWTNNLGIFDSGIGYPQQGLTNTTIPALLTYPTSCPTPTPTNTSTLTNTPNVTTTPTITPSVTITNTPTNTPTLTQTPSITPSQFNYSFQAYTGTTACLACCSASTLITLYGNFSAATNGPNLGEYIYTDSSLTQPVPDGTYAIPLGYSSSPNKWVLVNGGSIGQPGQVTTQDPNGCLDCCGCVVCTPTPTETPTPTPTPTKP